LLDHEPKKMLLTNWRSGEYIPAHSQEQAMRRIDWNRLMTVLVLVRIGQELGTDSQAARAIHHLLWLAGSIWR
jgi:hypothetical protein